MHSSKILHYGNSILSNQEERSKLSLTFVQTSKKHFVKKAKTKIMKTTWHNWEKERQMFYLCHLLQDEQSGMRDPMYSDL